MLRFATILILGLLVPLGATMAQNTPTAKEQDLNGFRLDKPAQSPTGPTDPIPSAQPEVKPTVKAPAQVVFQPNTQPTVRPKTELPKTATPVKKASLVKPEAKTTPQKVTDKKSTETQAPILGTAASINAPVTATPVDSAAGTAAAPGVDTILNDIAPAPVTETDTKTETTTTAPVTGPKSSSDPLVPGLIGAAIVSLLVLLMWLWSRRRRAGVQDTDETTHAPNAPEIVPIAAAMVKPDPEPKIEIEPKIIEAIPARVATTAPIAMPEPVTSIASTTSEIKLAFVPERIVISFNSLSLYGDLELHNTGTKPAHNVKLYTGLITANADQNAEMAAFHAGEAGVDPDDLDNMAAGEKIALSLSLALPLSEIQSYILGDQQLTVPIMLARVSHMADASNHGKAGEHVQTLSCIIGREAVPPQPKMGPLRLDMGPRSYASLGQRAITV